MDIELELDWARLGLTEPRAVKLLPQLRGRLSYLADIRDVFGPNDAVRVVAEFAGEKWLKDDLLRVRPWLDPQTPAPQLLTAILAAEWNGLLALLGDYGPWVYAKTVADLQQCSRLYSELIVLALQADEQTIFAAAEAGTNSPYTSLYTRLEATDYRQFTGKLNKDKLNKDSVPKLQQADEYELARLERQFWASAEAGALREYQAWQGRLS